MDAPAIGGPTGPTGTGRTARGWRRKVAGVALLSLTVFGLAGGVANAQGGGGTAKPPKGGVSPFVTPTLPDPTTFGAPLDKIHGFDVTGFIQDATVSADNAACPNTTDPARFGGTLTLNGVLIQVPCNTIIQMPANTFTWADFINGGPSLSVKDTAFPSFEMRAVGNIVGPKYIAGLLFASQQSANIASGEIKSFDYANGIMKVDDGQGGTTTVQINDPKVDGLLDSAGNGTGRFSAGQSPDPRFSVDQGNPTIHAGTGYPMCIPRTDPASVNDPLCPQVNRPKAAAGCRNFSQAGVVPPASGELARPALGQVYCSQYVMKSVTDATRVATDADPRQQVPFEVGDFVTYSGTLVHDNGTTQVNGGNDYVSAHTIEANLGVYTQPGTQPAYTAIGEFGVGTADPNATSVNGAAQETQDRMFLEAETTDVKTPVDIYMQDVDPQTGAVHNRWVTPFEMTGENQLGVPSGGITTQNTGPQPQRARLRATKAPTGLLSQPTRTIAVAQRSLKSKTGAACLPTLLAGTTNTIDQVALDACFNNLPTAANGLTPGQYYAPVFEYIFPENVQAGALPVPFDLWHLPALVKGEGATTASPIGSSVGPLEPSPW